MASPLLQDLGLRDPVEEFGTLTTLGEDIRDHLLESPTALSPSASAFLHFLSLSRTVSGDLDNLQHLLVQWAAISLLTSLLPEPLR